MSEQPVTRRERGLWRSVFVVVAVLLGIAAVILLVLNNNPKELKIGALVGAWSAIIGSMALFGPKRGHQDLAPAAPSGELELRKAFEVERQQDLAARRDYERQLEAMLRRELERVMRDELSALRSEVSQLRDDIEEKVSGQLKLERIETTRLIGSDLEALQHEVRRLAGATGADETIEMRTIDADRPVRPLTAVSPPAAPATPPAAPATPPVAPATPPAAAQPPVSPPAPPASAPAPFGPLPAVGESGSDRDPFADLPRLGSFTDPDDPVSAAVRADAAPRSTPDRRPDQPREDPIDEAHDQHEQHEAPVSAGQPVGYVGRRRHAAEGRHDGDETTRSRGREGADASDAGAAGGRRRRDDDQDNEVLARLLNR
jgi:gas vesicle protein